MTGASTAVELLVAQLGAVMPETEVTFGRSRGASGYRRTLVPVPPSRKPRLLVPESPRAAGAAAVRARSSAADGTTSRLSRAGLASMLHVGAGRLVKDHLEIASASAPQLVRDLADTLGAQVEGLSFSVAVGASRANAKPVLAVHGQDGRVLLWVKVATNGLTSRLVEQEHAALESLDGLGLRSLGVPRSRGLLTTPAGPALLLEPVVGHASPPRGVAAVPVVAIAEVATAAGVRTVAAKDWLTGLLGAALPDVTRRWTARRPATLTTGRWHGDWGPWNMSWCGATPQVWDWERYQEGVPVGVDAVHFAAHACLRGRDVRASSALLQRAASDVVLPTLRAAGVPLGPDDVEAVVDAYLLLVHHRFATEGEGEPTGAVTRLAEHYLEVLRARLDAFPARSTSGRSGSRYTGSRGAT